MTTDELKKEAEEYIKKNNLEWELETYRVSAISAVNEAYIASAEPREKHIAELEEENEELKERETEAEVIIDKFLDFESSAMECGLTLCGDTHKRAVRFLEED